MSGRISIRFVDFTWFSFDFDRVCFGLFRSFLVRNWCGDKTFWGIWDRAPDYRPCSACEALGVDAVLKEIEIMDVSRQSDRPRRWSASGLGAWCA
jgi:hypothetical protein